MKERPTLVKPDEPQNWLLVEGKDDEYVLYNLLEHHNIPERFTIKNKESITKLLDTLDVELERSGLERLGIIVDADTDLASRWRSLRKILLDAGYKKLPASPHADGTIIHEADRPVVGIWLMPDNKLPGMLEDFISFLVPPSDVLWPIAETTLQQVIAQDRRFPQAHHMKAHIHTWLAWQEEPGKPLGLAIKAHYLDADAAHARQFIVWIRQLFDLK